MAESNNDPITEILVETENYSVWRAEEPDGEVTFHLELNNLTVHFFREEWDEFMGLVRDLAKSSGRK